MAESKKHHYTPNFILKRFADQASRTLWVWDKQRHTCRPVRGGRNERYNAFLENHYNTVFGAGVADRSIEKFLENVESRAAPVIGMIVDFTRCGLLPILNVREKECLCQFLWAQHLRSPHLRAQWAEHPRSTQMAYRSILSTAMEMDVAPSEVRSLLEEAEDVVADATKMLVTMEHCRSLDYMTGMMSLDLGRVSTSTGGRLVTSDRPCLIGKSSQFEQGGRVCMAVAEDVMVQLSRPQDSRGDVYRLGIRRLNQLNRQTFRAATRFVAGSRREYLENLAKEATERRSS